MQQKLIAEFFGTATLAFAVLASLSVSIPIVSTPIVAGLTLMLFVYAIGAISGSHLNPAVTIGAWAIRKIPTKEATWYVLAQCLGGFAAFLLATNLFPNVSAGFAPESFTQFIAEFIGMTIFTFSIASVIYHKTTEAATGLVIGGSLTLGILCAMAAGSAGILNPAVGIALGMVSLSNIAGSIFGAVLGMHLYRYLVR